MKTFILGTDWWTDCDDAVALRLLCRHVKENKIKLSGVAINAAMEYSVASMRGFLRAEGLGDIPIGLDRDARDFGGDPPYQKRLRDDYAPEVTNADASDACSLYRSILASATEKLEIIEIGFLQAIADVLESPPDDISDKSGIELFSEKVSRVWVMAGRWDIDGGRENNFARNQRSRVGADKFLRLCPVPVTFLGFEVGYDVISGSSLPTDDHLYRVLLDHGSERGRRSWDPMLTLLALIGDADAAGYDTVRGIASVDPETGLNSFTESALGNHTYVKRRHPPEHYAAMIDSML